MWLVNVSVALVEASAYDDQAEITSLRAANDGISTFEFCKCSGDAWLANLDMVLAIAVNAKLYQGDFAQVVKKKTLDAFAAGKLLIGRQLVHLLCHHLKINADMSLVYSVAELAASRRRLEMIRVGSSNRFPPWRPGK
jgi:hypothetical protein